VSAPSLRIETHAVTVDRPRRERWFDRMVLILAWVVGVAMLSGQAVTSATGICMVPAVLVALTSWIVGRHLGAPVVGVRAQGARGAMIIGPRAVLIERGEQRVRFTRDEIIGGWTERFRDGEAVVLETRGGALLRAAVRSAEEGRAALRAAGVGPEQRAVAIRLGAAEASSARAAHVFFAIVMLTVFASFGALAMFMAIDATTKAQTVGVLGLVALMGLGMFFVVAQPLVATTVRIGTDGVFIERPWRKRFIPRAEISNADVHEGRLVLLLERGELISLPTSSTAEAAAVAARIREALADRGGASAAVLARLDRQGRPFEAWLRDLRALARPEGGYREAGLDRRALLEVVEDPTASPERRLAAAAALAPVASRDEEARARVRVAAEACADERLRVAIDGAGAGALDEAMFEEALTASRRG
jgi:hypothetical protein